jgi:hypothetical protein
VYKLKSKPLKPAHHQGKHPTVERLGPWIDGPTCSVYLVFRLKSTFLEYVHAMIKIAVH